MKKIAFLIILLVSFASFSQDDPKIAFQKRKYDLALTYYKKDDLKNALDLFSIASRIKPDNVIGQEAAKHVDTLKGILRKRIMDHAVGIWKIGGNIPIWVFNKSNKEDNKDELLQVSQTKISYYQLNKISNEKKLIKSEDLIFYNEGDSDALYSQVILSNGTIWNCELNESWTELRVICVGKKVNGTIEKITTNNEELFFVRVK